MYINLNIVKNFFLVFLGLAFIAATFWTRAGVFLIVGCYFILRVTLDISIFAEDKGKATISDILFILALFLCTAAPIIVYDGFIRYVYISVFLYFVVTYFIDKKNLKKRESETDHRFVAKYGAKIEEIREFRSEDVEQVMTIWYDVTVHDQSFVPESFWREMRDVVREKYIPAARTWVFVDSDGKVLGFVSLIGDLIGALFVSRENQSRGIGRKLVEHAAEKQSPLFVDVYEKNARARRFYRNCGFVEVESFIQKETGETVIKNKLEQQTE